MKKFEDKLNLLVVDLSARLTNKVIVECPITSYIRSIPSTRDYCVLTNIDPLEKTYSVGSKYTRRKGLSIYYRDKILIKPCLRPMSSMTEEERIEFSKLLHKRYCEEDWEGHISTSYCIEIDNVYTDDENGIKYPSVFSMDAIDWLNAHHFDYRGLIELGLAIDVTKLNKNPYNDEFIY